jgi:catechol 2,3-dioxygenase-like lactoylglutathione lyase family enzyme
MPEPTKPAGRFLHICYCCADGPAATSFFVEQLAMRNTMSTPMERVSGESLGVDGEMEVSAAFVYDARGPRVSPAIEVQQWNDPPLLGEPSTDPTAAGIAALGFGVADPAAAIERLTAARCTVVAAGTSAFGTAWTTLRDAAGVTLDVVEDTAVPAGESRMRHLRVSCTDLERSLAWYDGLGFEVAGTHELTDAGFLGLTGPVEATAARLRLPEESFEVLLIQWTTPASHGRHHAEAYHAGLFRAALRVDDTRVAHEEMTAAGWAFDRAPMEVELHGTPVPDMWIAFLSDPDGVPFEFVQRPKSAFRT